MSEMLFVHGWGQSRQIWKPCMSIWPDAHYINLPGHGGEPDAEPDSWLDSLPGEKPMLLIGWSLGGMLALRLALRLPRRIKGLVLIATTPKFCMTADWDAGCPAHVFSTFKRQAITDPERLLRRFFDLMLQGEELSMSARRRLQQECMNTSVLPSIAAMKHGLSLLQSLDLRPHLNEIRVPCLIVHGHRDVIVPHAAGKYLCEHLPRADMRSLESAGHAPFLNHTRAFRQTLEEWCRKL